MTERWTRGPWRAADKMVIVVAETHGYDTCIANTAIGGSGGEQQRANARLVAAAPALFDALEQTWRVLRAAGLHNLANGVQLGRTSWFVKASDAETMAEAALASARDTDGSPQGGNAEGGAVLSTTAGAEGIAQGDGA